MQTWPITGSTPRMPFWPTTTLWTSGYGKPWAQPGTCPGPVRWDRMPTLWRSWINTAESRASKGCGWVMIQNAGMKPPMSLIVSLVLLMGLAALPAEAQVQRVIFASAGFDETNRFWVISRPNQLQNDPYLETLLDLDPKTGAFIPR